MEAILEAWNRMVVEDALEGGPGSGHYGHSGRKGLVGGSAAGVGGVSMPLTITKLPTLGKGEIYFIRATTKEEVDAYVTGGENALGHYWRFVGRKSDLPWTIQANATGYGGSNPHIIIGKGNLKELELEKVDLKINEGEMAFPSKDLFHKQLSPSSKVLWVGKVSDLFKKESEVLEGGPGSGNFAHAGRKGLIGGSAPGRSSSPFARALRSGAKRGMTAQDALRAVAESGLPSADLARAVLKTGDGMFKDMTFRTERDPAPGERDAWYARDRKTNEIVMTSSFFNKASDAELASIVVHEAMHGRVDRIVPGDLTLGEDGPKGRAYKERVDHYINDKKTDPNVRDLLKQYKHALVTEKVPVEDWGNPMSDTFGSARGRFKGKFPYGYGTFGEYISEGFTNPKFQARLNGIRYRTRLGRVTNLWKSFTSSVSRILGMKPKQRTLLDAFFRTSSKLLYRGEAEVMEGGPGSGHHGHSGGIGGPGNPGGSTARGGGGKVTGKGKGTTYKFFGYKGGQAQAVNSFGKSLNKSFDEWSKSNNPDNPQDDEDFGDATTALDNYVNYDVGGARDVNWALRHGKLGKGEGRLYEEQREMVAGMDKLMKHSVIPENVTALRGISADVHKKLEKKVGSIVRDKGFVSTTLYSQVLRVANEYGEYPYEAEIRIKVPKGTRGIYVDRARDYGTGRNEFELILDRGLKFKVKKENYDLVLEVVK